MKHVLKHMEELTRSFARLEYFQMLERPGTWSDVEIMGQGLSFFVLCFQDMLRLNASLVADGRLVDIVREQRRDDAGHDDWFLADLQRLKLEPSLRALFGRQHRATRDTSYAIIAEILKAPSDPARLAIGLSLEATGGVYFARVHEFFARLGLDEGLRFFSRHHWDAEQSHDVVQDHGRERLEAIVLSQLERQQAVVASERTFSAMRSMCDSLSSRMLEARARPPRVQGAGPSEGSCS